MGIYVHIPFCRSKCFYCGFYSVASLSYKDAFIKAVSREIRMRNDYLRSAEVDTLYLGGGTPSYLTETDLHFILDSLLETYCFVPGAEWTIEMNPEDITPSKLKALLQMGFNRLSIGVQSFREETLKKINRTHTALQVFKGLELARQSGFENISIDLIAGLPGQTRLSWEEDLKYAIDSGVTHISVYMLGIDEGSVFARQMERGLFQPPAEEELVSRYQSAVRKLTAAGYVHYEISNFARDGRYSRHNTAYWQQKEYVGFGPAAHSYDGVSRQWNISNVKIYCDSLDKDILPFDREELSCINKYNEYIMTGLRTMWGISLAFLQTEYPQMWEQRKDRLDHYREKKLAEKAGDNYRLTEAGWLISDTIFSDLFGEG